MSRLLGATTFLLVWCLAMSLRDKHGRKINSKGELIREKFNLGYTNSWVVEMDVDEKEADEIAESHGFINLGPVIV